MVGLVQCVFDDVGEVVVVFWGYSQYGIGGFDFGFQIGYFGGYGFLQIFVVMWQGVDVQFDEVQFVFGQFFQCVGQFVVD